MSTASVAAAKIYIALQSDFSFQTAFNDSVEPYRAVVDLSRTRYMHNVIDGSEDYEQLVDCLEMLVCGFFTMGELVG
jgi:hypothetical protein